MAKVKVKQESPKYVITLNANEADVLASVLGAMRFTDGVSTGMRFLFEDLINAGVKPKHIITTDDGLISAKRNA